MTTIKTFADFKRAAVIGAKFRRTFVDPVRVPEKFKDQPSAIRTVNHVQSNGIAFEVDSGDGKSWFYWPKSGQYRMEDGKLILLDLGDKPRMTLELVE